MPTTRWLYASDQQLASLRDAGCYVFAPDGSITPWTGAPTGDTFNFYEVATIASDPAGSWWLPTAPQSQVPAAWLNAPGGAIALAATGGIWTEVTRGGQVEPVQRPDMLLWWVPRDSLAQLTEFPGSVTGAVTGAFPSIAPPRPSPPPPPPPDNDDGDDLGDEGDGWRRRADYNVALRASTTTPLARPALLRSYRARLHADRLGALPVRPPGPNWIPLGPSVGLHGQGVVQPDVSGRITGIAVAPGGQRVYIATANGGVWRSDDGGDSFVSTMDAVDIRPTVGLADALACGAIAIHPGRPDHVFVGSGEAPGGMWNPQREGTMYFGVGALVSEDGGRSWLRERLEPPPPLGQGSAFYTLAVDPSDPALVMGATMSGLYRREARNADQFPGVTPPQSYFIQYEPATRAAYTHYWATDGLTAPRAAWGGAGMLPEANATLVSFLVDGEPWFVSYAPGNGNFNLYRVDGAGAPAPLVNGNWPINLTLMPVTLAGDPYLVLYRAGDGATWLKRLGRGPGYVIADAWNPAQAAWPANVTSLVPLAFDGVPAFLRYQSGAGTCQLMQWNSDLSVTQIWQENWDTNLSLAGFALRGRPAFLRWKADGSLGLYGFTPDLRSRRVWADPANTYAAGCTFIPFPFDDAEHFLAYRAADGWASLNTLGINTGRRRNLWIETWAIGQQIMPFPMGYVWRQRLAGNVTGLALGDDGDVAIAWAVLYGGDTYSSLDRGRTWHRARQPLPRDAGRVTLAMQRTNPYVVYASTQTGLVFRNDGSGSPFLWRLIHGIPSQYVQGQGNYDLALVVAPDDANRIYVGGCWVQTPAAAFAEGDQYVAAIYRCDIDPTGVTPTAQLAYIGNSVHADVHTFAFQPDPPHALWVGCDGGLFVSTKPNDLRDLDIFTAKNAGLVSMTMNHLGQHPTEDAVLFCGTQDNGNVRSISSEAWLHWAPGDSGYVVVNRTTPANVLCTGYNQGLRSSTNGGQRYPNNLTYPAVPTGPEPMLFYAPMVGTAATAGAFTADWLAFGAQRPWFSADFGATWASLGVLLPNLVSALGFSLDGTRLYAGTLNGRIYSYTYAGGWGPAVDLTGAGGGPLPGTAVTGFAFDAAAPFALWASFGGTIGNADHVWYLNAVNNAWTARGGAGATALLDIHYNCIVADAANPGTIYVGGDLGVWRSTDSGATWTAFAQGLPESAVIDLALFPANGGRQAPALLRAATFGRGVWERVLDNTAAFHRAVQLYVRKTYLDRGLYPVVDGLPSPIDPLVPVNVNHRYSPDVKFVQSPAGTPFAVPAAIDFARFAKLEPTGNAFPTLDRTQTTRLFAQVHNRGVVPARDVKVSILLSQLIAAPPIAPAPIVGVPNPPILPDNYWDRVDEGWPFTNADWTSVAVVTIPEVRVGVPIVVSGDLSVAQINTAGLYCVLVLVACADDRFRSHQRNVDTLTINEPQAAMRYLVSV